MWKTVTDADMLKLANDKVAQFKSDNSNSLDAGLIANINSSWVDWTLVYPIPFDKCGLSDTFSKERTANANSGVLIAPNETNIDRQASVREYCGCLFCVVNFVK